jgi:hypothetical protein
MTMTKTIVVTLALLISGGCCDVRDRMQKQCIDDCLSYGAGYMRLKATCGDTNGCCSSEGDFECWCRRGAESGGGSEPLRIW